jgi:hypothetical protein
VKLRSPAAPLLLPLITFGIYSLVWYVKTKNEMNQKGGKQIPTAWLLIIPIASIVWLWKYSVGVERFTAGAMSRYGAFWLIFLLGSIGAAIVQASFNSALRYPSTVQPSPVTV